MSSGMQKTVKLPMRKANLISLDSKTGKLVVVRPTENGHDYVEILNISNNNHCLPCKTISPENGSIQNVIIIDNGEFVIVFSNGSVRFCNEKHCEPIKIIQIPGSEIVASCTHDTSNSTICLMTGTTLNIFDLNSKNILSSIIMASKCNTSPIVSDGYKIAIGLSGDIILVEEMKKQFNLKLSPRCQCEENAPRSLLFMDSNILVCGDSLGTVTFWNIDDFTLIQSLPCLLSSIFSMVTTADRLLYVCGEDPRLTKIGQSSTGEFEILERKAGPVDTVRSMATSDNTVYVAGDDKSIYVSHDDEYSKVAFHQMNFYDQYETELHLANAGDNFIDIYCRIKNDEDEYSSKRCFDYEFIQKIKTPLLRTISCWDISNNSQFLVISTSHDTVFYEREKD